VPCCTSWKLSSEQFLRTVDLGYLTANFYSSQLLTNLEYILRICLNDRNYRFRVYKWVLFHTSGKLCWYPTFLGFCGNSYYIAYCVFMQILPIVIQTCSGLLFLPSCTVCKGARGSVVVKALCYKPEGRGFDTRWGEFLNLPNPSGCTRPWSLLSL
jgi:hypothetical protein